MELRKTRPAHVRAREPVGAVFLGSALFAALNSALFGVNVQEQWGLPQVVHQHPPSPLLLTPQLNDYSCMP